MNSHQRRKLKRSFGTWTTTSTLSVSRDVQLPHGVGGRVYTVTNRSAHPLTVYPPHDSAVVLQSGEIKEFKS